MATAVYMAPEALRGLLENLRESGYTLIGPKARGPAIVLETLDSMDDLPWGWQDHQSVGAYAVQKTTDRGCFQFNCGPDSWKRFLIPPVSRLFHLAFGDDDVAVTCDEPPPLAYAFVGMRACDLKALAILDRVMLGQDYPDPGYQAVRRLLFIVAVNCLTAGGTCFCSIVGGGPRADSGFDLVLDEICTPDRHGFLVEAGSRRGADMLATARTVTAAAADLQAVRRQSTMAAATMAQQMPLSLPPAADIDAWFGHPHWQTMDQRCLACGNCTLVCPTCFCHTVEEVECLGERQAARQRLWDSCFSQKFSHIHGGSIRDSIGSRYRQWLMHKLSTWPSQFGTSGCVGCGRCRTWCPAGIDIIEEVHRLAGDGQRAMG